ncbi:MAG TPA: helical backbone metal receptor [Flavisolibacter sp.]|nr:helical backbone metal receptor [Flavisolibacter sp.]
MLHFKNQIGRSIILKETPKRIISLVPSQTELLFDMGLQDEVIGITKFCKHPHQWFQTKTRVGGTKKLHIEKIKELQPHLIIANKEENVQEQIEELAAAFPVWVSDVNNLDDALNMIASVGELTGKQIQAEKLTTEIKINFSSSKHQSPNTKPLTPNTKHETPNSKPKACYLIWKEPYMTVGGDTFINDMLQHAGFENMYADQLRYPVVELTDLAKKKCELLLLSSEPFPFKQKHVDELKQILPDVKIILVDGEMFSWYGSRLLHAQAYFQKLQNEIAAIS